MGKGGLNEMKPTLVLQGYFQKLTFYKKIHGKE